MYICEASSKNDSLDICGQSSSRSAFTIAQSDLKATLSTEKSLRPLFTKKQTVKLSDQTVRMGRLIFSYTVSICPKIFFLVTRHILDMHMSMTQEFEHELC